jgi:hypothetical protein
MKKSDKVILIGGLALSGLMLGAALVYGAVQNVRADNARIEREVFADSEEQQRLRAVERERWKAALLTPEGKAAAARKRAVMVKQLEASSAKDAVQAVNAASVVRPSAWDGSVEIVEEMVRASANDPGAVKFNEWRNFAQGEQHLTVVDFTVVNALGGSVRHSWRVLLESRSGKVKGLHDGARWVIDPAPAK